MGGEAPDSASHSCLAYFQASAIQIKVQGGGDPREAKIGRLQELLARHIKCLFCGLELLKSMASVSAMLSNGGALVCAGNWSRSTLGGGVSSAAPQNVQLLRSVPCGRLVV